MNKAELLRFLDEIGARPKRGLSQNFLIDNNVLQKIVQLAEVKPGDCVLEIGPAPGALTEQLLNAGAKVTAIEMDRTFAEHLSRFQTKDRRLTVHEGDFLDFPLSYLSPGTWKVVANVPYHITSPILEKLCMQSAQFSSFTLMVQKEVAERIRAKPGTKALSSLTLFLQFYTEVHDAFNVSAGCFFPAPNVDSTVIRLDTRIPPDVDPNVLFPMIRKAFQQRRKMLTSTLGKEMAPVLEQMGLSAKARPEELSLEQWIRLVSSC